MRKIVSICIACSFLFLSLGCERTDTAIDLYKKVKEDSKQKARQAQDEAQKIIEKKAKDAMSPRDSGDSEKDKDKE
jgi:uncharacterized protein YgiB involved in biofilm formation